MNRGPDQNRPGKHEQRQPWKRSWRGPIAYDLDAFPYICAVKPRTYRGNSEALPQSPKRIDPGAVAALAGEIYLYPSEPTGRLNLRPSIEVIDRWLYKFRPSYEAVRFFADHGKAWERKAQRAQRVIRMARKKRRGYA